MNAYDKSVDAVIFKQEDTIRNGTPIGPVWVRRGGEMKPHEEHIHGGPTWFSLRQAKRIAAEVGLPFYEV